MDTSRKHASNFDVERIARGRGLPGAHCGRAGAPPGRPRRPRFAPVSRFWVVPRMARRRSLATVVLLLVCQGACSPQPVAAPETQSHPPATSTSDVAAQRKLPVGQDSVPESASDPNTPLAPFEQCEAWARSEATAIARRYAPRADSTQPLGAPGKPDVTGAGYFSPSFEYAFGETSLDDQSDGGRILWTLTVVVEPGTGELYVGCDPGASGQLCRLAHEQSQPYARAGKVHVAPPAGCAAAASVESCATQWSSVVKASDAFSALPQADTLSVHATPTSELFHGEPLHWSVLASWDVRVIDMADVLLKEGQANVVEGLLQLEGEPVKLSHDQLRDVAARCRDPRLVNAVEAKSY